MTMVNTPLNKALGYLMLIISTIFLGMAEGLQPVFSYFTGTGEDTRNQNIRRFAAKIFLSIGVLFYLFILFFSSYFFSIFTPEDTKLIDFMTSKSIPYFCGFFLAGYNILMISYWQSTQRTTKAFLISFSRSLIFPPILIFILPVIFGGKVIWLCHSIGEGLTACVVLVLLFRNKKQERIER